MTLSPRLDVNSGPPIRCLIVQLARLGDTLQSLMALRAAKQLYPHLEIHFLCRDRFSCAAKRIPWIHSVITFPTAELLGPIIHGEKNKTQTLGDLARWIAPLVKDPWDMVINWTFSESSSYLTALVPARVKLGYTRRRDSTFAGADGWSHFIQAIVQNKIYQNIHLTDILTTQFLTALQIHKGDPIGDGNSTVTSKGFFSLQLTEDEVRSSNTDSSSRKWISIQLCAVKNLSIWSVKSWVQLIQFILQRHPDHGIYLLGTEAELPSSQLILEEMKNHPAITHLVNLVGKTSFDLWASTISRSQWLIAGDSAAIHLASVLGVRVLNIAIGSIRYFETGPYGNGHYVVTSARNCEGCLVETSDPHVQHTCSSDIPAEAIYATWAYANNEWAHRRQISIETHFSRLGWSHSLSAIRAYRTRIRNPSDGGGVLYEPILKRPLRIEEWTGMVMGHLARGWYCGWLPPVGQELTRESMSPSLIQKLREMSDSTQVLSKICLQASQTADSLRQKSLALKSDKIMGVRDREEIQELGKSLLDLETLLERITKTHPALMGFSQMSKVLMHHLQGAHLSDLGKETAECYRQINEGVLIFRQWIFATLALIKPMAVKAATVTALELLPPTPEQDLPS